MSRDGPASPSDPVEEALLEVETCIVEDELERAEAMLAALRADGLEDPEIDYLQGVVRWRGGDDEGATRCFQAALAVDDEHSDACHGLYMLHEAAGQFDAAVEYAVRVRRLDETHDNLDAAVFEARAQEIRAVAAQVLGGLPEQFEQRLENVPVVLEPRPSEDLVRSGFDPRALGLFEGPEDRARMDPGPMPARIVLFTHNLTAEFPESEELREQVEVTLLHEIGHFFGLDEEGVEALGLG